MKVSELIRALILMPQDLEVCSVCNHERQPELCQLPSVKCMNDYYESWVDEEDAESYGYSKTVVLL